MSSRNKHELLYLYSADVPADVSRNTARAQSRSRYASCNFDSVTIHREMENRPKLKIELSKGDKFIEAACLTILVVLWVSTISLFAKLPDQIPSHYNAAGQADDFSKKAHIFILPIVATVIYVGMTILNKHPHIYNYPATVTTENARRLYTSMTRLIRVLKLAVVIIFSGIVFMTYKKALTNESGFGVWFLPAAIALMIIPNIFYLIKSTNSKPTSQ